MLRTICNTALGAQARPGQAVTVTVTITVTVTVRRDRAHKCCCCTLQEMSPDSGRSRRSLVPAGPGCLCPVSSVLCQHVRDIGCTSCLVPPLPCYGHPGHLGTWAYTPTRPAVRSVRLVRAEQGSQRSSVLSSALALIRPEFISPLLNILIPPPASFPSAYYSPDVHLLCFFLCLIAFPLCSRVYRLSSFAWQPYHSSIHCIRIRLRIRVRRPPRHMSNCRK